MSAVGSFFRFLFKGARYLVKFIQGMGTLTLGVLALATIISLWGMQGGEKAPSVPHGAVLVLWPNGQIVEQVELPDPFEALFNRYDSAPPQTSIHDITTALKRAKADDRIKGLAIITDSMMGAAPAHLHSIAAAVRDFKTGGKKVYALSTAYDQGDYLIAAEADKVFMNPAGSALLTGFGSYPLYFKSLLEKIEANVSVFRVGTYKSAVEPFIRDDMSDAAREANLTFLNGLWDQYDASVTTARGLEAGSLNKTIAAMPENLRAAGGDFATLAVDTGLVDELAARNVWRQALMDEFGEDSSGISFRQINYQAYLAATNSLEHSDNEIAVITAQGEIVGGYGPVSVSAAETLVGYIRDARNDPATAAILLRVDSPGGSVVASELIRQELVAAQEQGLKVIVSMGPVAASGGYWISATADEIWAEPSTITGSIGIFGIMSTFEKTLDKAGVHSDGVGTSPFAGAFSISRPLNDMTKDVVQQSIESGYRQFLALVAEGRNMSLEDVDKIAQGRVWIGATAKDLGLVDQLGGFDEAVAAAAKAAEVEGDFKLVFYREQPNPYEQAIADLLNGFVGADIPGQDSQRMLSPLLKAAQKLESEAKFLLQFDDPLGQYSLCLTCEVR